MASKTFGVRFPLDEAADIEARAAAAGVEPSRYLRLVFRKALQSGAQSQAQRIQARRLRSQIRRAQLELESLEALAPDDAEE